MDGVLVVFTLLCISGLQAEDEDILKEIDGIQLVRGSSPCSGQLQVKRYGDWREVGDVHWDLNLADEVCRHLDCGSVVQIISGSRQSRHAWTFTPSCLDSASTLRKCITKRIPHTSVWITCSDSVRLVNSTHLCSGRVEVKLNGSWSSVCEDDFNQNDALVVCRHLGCGAPSVLQEVPYGRTEAPAWNRELHCEGKESALLDCDSSARNTCLSGKAVQLTCSEPEDLRLVRGTSRCAGELEVEKQREWNRVDDQMSDWNLKTADVICRRLDCGSAVLTGRTKAPTHAFIWWIRSTCLQSESAVRQCVFSRKDNSIFNLEITCSDSIRLVDGNSLCSGRLEVKSDQLWSSVCEDDFNLLDAEVVCRELGCGAPSALQGALYGEVEAPVWSKEFQCDGRESALLDCRQSGSARDTCSPGKAVGLTCSAPDEVRLVGGASRCVGRLEMKHKGDWRPVADHSSNWDLLSAAVVCRQLGCGSALSTDRRNDTHQPAAWIISSFCGPSESALRECGLIWSNSSNSRLEVNCLDSIRLVDGNSLCSGRLEVKSDQLWSSVCEDDFDLQDAEVVCRELGCGAPSALQGALYGEGEAPVRSTEFLCDGQESALLDCGSSDSAADTCSSGKAVSLTCSELDNIRLTGGASRCDGTLEMKQHGEWRPVADRVFEWEQKLAPSVCRQLTCGSAVSAEIKDTSGETVWWIRRSCVQSDSTLRECLQLPSSATSYTNLEVLCSGSLAQPNISFSTHFEELSEANHQEPQVELGSRFIISCSFLPQYPGGFFQLILTTSATSQSSTLPAVGHSAHFRFPVADHSHQGEYRCVYRIYAFSQNVSFESQTLYVAVSAPLTDLVIRVLVLLLIMKFFAALLFFVFYCKSSRRRTPRREDNITLDYVNDARESLRE